MCEEVFKGLIQSKSLFSYPDHELTCFQGFFWESNFFPFSSSIVLQLLLSLFCERMGTTLTGTHYWQLEVLILRFGYNLKFPCTSLNFEMLNVLKYFFFFFVYWVFSSIFCGQECHKHRYLQFSLFLILFPILRNIHAFNFRWALKVSKAI